MAKKPKSIFDEFSMSPEMEDFLVQNHRDAVFSPRQWWETAQKLWLAGVLVFEKAEVAIQRQSERFRQQKEGQENGDKRTVVSTPSQVEGQAFFRDYIEGGMKDVSLMLFGMALECLIKGVLISRSGDDVWKDGRFAPPLGHYLPTAALRIRGDIDQRSLELLKILSECIFWRGRYPVDKQPNISGPIVALDRDFGTFQWFGMDKRYDDTSILNALYREFENALIEEIRKGARV